MFGMDAGLRKDYDMGPAIGEGSFSIVRLGIRRSNGENVAIKVIDKKSIKFKDNVVQREIATMKLVDHPNCVMLYDIYDDSKHKYLVMELVTGGTVMDRVVEMTHFTEKDAATVTTHVLRALEHLHALGITHRDIKPENLLYKSNDPLSPDYNTVKLADFGLAKFVGVDETMKTTCGTPGYVAPEIIDPKMPFGDGYGPSVDIWSLGIVLYIMLCGFPPFLHESTAVLFQLIRKGEFDFPTPYWDAVSSDAMDLVSKMLVVDAKSRLNAEQCLDHPWISVSGPEAGRTLHSSHHAFMLIRKLQIFDNVDPACMQAVCSCLKVKKFPKGASVIRAGEIGDSMYFINNGVVKVEKQDLLSHFMMSSQTGLSGGARDRSIVYRRFFRRDRSYRFRESHCRRVICWELAHEGGCKKCDGRDGDRGHGIVSTLALGF
uniref:Protein kinase domain-containing protein n=1 Tax=Guillardia theta TaxID=55529 RepID=A0A7S4P3Z5_GUITH|mmetsp:Transcript_42727/g.134639  ORF Transcript_42727/g.134639 Transcript_42727/m.134639 type:complete len:432 (+) Transcript_42727:232-1527(+)